MPTPLTLPAFPSTQQAAVQASPRLCTWQVSDKSAYIPATLLSVIIAGSDLAALGCASVLACVVSTGGEGHVALPLLASLACTLLLIAMGVTRRAALEHPLHESCFALSLSVTLVNSLTVLAVSWLGIANRFQASEFSAWLIAAIAALVASRWYMAHLVRQWAAAGRLERRVAIYGAGVPCANLITSLEADPSCDIRIVGVCDERGNERVGTHVLGYPRIGSLDDLISLARRSRIDTIVVTLPIVAEKRLLQIFDRLSVLPADVRQPASATGLRFTRRAYSYIGLLPMLAIQDKPIGSWGTIAKSAFDRLVACVALVLLAPVLAAVAIAIKLDSRGPVLFRQNRYGFNNELIGVLKFRSMYSEQTDASAQRLVSKGDPRVTRVGRFIRRSSLDELPQLLNVLRGELSLVGPRPHAVNAKAGDRLYGDVVRSYFARHKVKPGITGWAQINGWRGETDTEEKILKRVEHDLHYVENWSLFLDLKILALTPFALLNTENAY